MAIGGFKPRTIRIWNKKKLEKIPVSSREDIVRECRKRGKVHMGYMHFDKEKGEE